MADQTTIQIKRTSITGRAANTTTLTNPGELALNMTDGIMYSTNGTAVFEIGANNTNISVTNNLNLPATSNVNISSGAKIIDSTGSQGTSGQVLTSNGTGNVYWSTPSVNTDAQYVWSNTQTFSNGMIFGNSKFNSNTFTTSGTTAQVCDVFPTSYKTAKYITQISFGTSIHSTEMLIINNGVDVNILEYGTIYSNGSLGTFSANLNATNIELVCTPVNSGSIIKTTRMCLI